MNVLFIHIPRTGGTTVEHWLRELGQLRMFSYSIPLFSKVTPQHLRMNDIDELLGENFFDYIFAIVRNPFDRIASEFRLRCELQRKSFFGGAPRFPTWLETNLTIFRQNPFHLDNHLRPNWQFISSRARVFRYEDGLEAVLTQVAADLGAPPPSGLIRALATDSANVEVRFNIAETELMLEVYDADFKRFGYARTPPPLSRSMRGLPAGKDVSGPAANLTESIPGQGDGFDFVMAGADFVFSPAKPVTGESSSHIAHCSTGLDEAGRTVLRLAGGDADAPSSGTTGGFSIRVPDAFERAASGRDIRVRVLARAGKRNTAGGRLAVAYSTCDVGNSGWHWYDVTPEWSVFEMQYSVPEMKGGNGDFIGLLPGGPGTPTVEIGLVAVAVL